jgi:hypothetical protein
MPFLDEELVHNLNNHLERLGSTYAVVNGTGVLSALVVYCYITNDFRT